MNASDFAEPINAARKAMTPGTAGYWALYELAGKIAKTQRFDIDEFDRVCGFTDRRVGVKDRRTPPRCTARFTDTIQRRKVDRKPR